MPTLRTYAGSNANHTYSASVGIYFTVASGQTLYVSDLGAFAAGGVGVPSGVTITVSLVNRSASTTMLAQTTFTNASQGTVDATNRLMTKSVTPVALPAGDYCVWASGYAASYQAYNSTQPSPGTAPVTSTFGGAVTLGNDFYSIGTTMPTTDGGTTKFGGPTLIATTVAPEDNMTVATITNTNVTSSVYVEIAAATKTVLVQAQGGAVFLYHGGTIPAATQEGFQLQPVGLSGLSGGSNTGATFTMASGVKLWARAVGANATVSVVSD